MIATPSSLFVRRTLINSARSAAVFVVLLLSASCSSSGNGGTGPTSGFGIVLEQVGVGVVANPSRNTTYTPGTVVNYAFTAQDGLSSVHVTLDGTEVPASGTVILSQNRAFRAVINNQVGFHAPDFSGRNAAGQTVRLSDYAGRITLVDFAEPTCVGSPPEANALKTHYASYHARGLEILTVLVSCPGLSNCPANSPASSSALQSWQTTYNLPYPVISDVSGVTAIYNWSIPEKTTDFPVTYIVNPAGQIISRFRGFDGPTISAALAVLFP